MKFTYSGVEISFVAGIVPTHKSYFDDEMTNYAHDPSSSKKLKVLMGYGEHRVENRNRTVTDYVIALAAEVGADFIKTLEDIDALIVVTQTPDYLIPPTSCVLHGLMGLKPNVYCLDINDGCSGYVKGLNQACMILNSSDARNVLLVAGDILSGKVSKHDRNSYPLIGDAVTLSLISKAGIDKKITVEINTDGAGFEKLRIPAGGLKRPINRETSVLVTDDEGNSRSLEDLHMNGRDVFAFTQTVVPDFVNDYLSRKKLSIKDYDRFYFHQANSFIIDRLRMKFDVNADFMPDNVVRTYGNSSSATIPMLIASDAVQTEKRCLLTGFGVGLQWGLADVQLGANVSKGIKEF